MDKGFYAMGRLCSWRMIKSPKSTHVVLIRIQPTYQPSHARITAVRRAQPSWTRLRWTPNWPNGLIARQMHPAFNDSISRHLRVPKAYSWLYPFGEKGSKILESGQCWGTVSMDWICRNQIGIVFVKYDESWTRHFPRTSQRRSEWTLIPLKR